MSFSLNYYNVSTLKDYKPIKSFSANDVDPLMALTNLYSMALTNLYSGSAPFYLENPSSSGSGSGPSLYNGNISSMVTSFIDRDVTNTHT